MRSPRAGINMGLGRIVGIDDQGWISGIRREKLLIESTWRILLSTGHLAGGSV